MNHTQEYVINYIEYVMTYVDLCQFDFNQIPCQTSTAVIVTEKFVC